jgi:biopolymer transport protein ExbB
MDAFLEFVTHHWYFAFPMFIMMIIAGVMVIWRALLYHNAKTDMNLFLPRFQDVLQKEGVEGALKFCRAQPDSEVIPRKLYVAGLENAKSGIGAMKRAMATVVELEIVPDFNFLLAPILGIAKISTMVGLFGTVISMIFTFQELGKSEGGGGQAKASQQIGLALFATALGILTAIPLVFMHVMFKAWIHKYEIKMKNAGSKLILLVQSLKDRPPQPAGAPAAGAPGAAAAVTTARPVTAQPVGPQRS